jgi:hypothetical protein
MTVQVKQNSHSLQSGVSGSIWWLELTTTEMLTQGERSKRRWA